MSKYKKSMAPAGVPKRIWIQKFKPEKCKTYGNYGNNDTH